MIKATNPIRTAAFVLIARYDRGSKAPRTNDAEGDPYLLQPSGPPLEDEGPPLVGVPRHDGPYNQVECPHPLGGGRDLMMIAIGVSTQDHGDGEAPDAFHAGNPP